MNIRLLGLAILVLMLFALPALAHHSFAMFDQGKVVYMTGPRRHLRRSKCEFGRPQTAATVRSGRVSPSEDFSSHGFPQGLALSRARRGLD